MTKLGLNPVGLVTLGTAGGPSQQALYPLKVALPQIGPTFEIESVTGCDLTGTGLVLLIGRDVLRLSLFSDDGVSGAYTLAI